MSDLSFIELVECATARIDNQEEIERLRAYAESKGFLYEFDCTIYWLRNLKLRILGANQYNGAPAQQYYYNYNAGRLIQPISANPQPVTPRSVAPQPITPQPVAPQPVTPQSVTPQPANVFPRAESAALQSANDTPKRKPAAASPATIKEYPDKKLAKDFLQAVNELAKEQDASRWQKKIGSKGFEVIALTSSNGEVWVESGSLQGDCLCAVRSGNHVYAIPSPADPSLFSSAIPKWFNMKGVGSKYRIEGVSVGGKISNSSGYVPIMKGGIIKEDGT